MEVSSSYLNKSKNFPRWKIQMCVHLFFAVSFFTTLELYRVTGIIIKQFVVTNCSKERPGSIVTETLKNGILIPIYTSKEWYFYADFKIYKFYQVQSYP